MPAASWCCPTRPCSARCSRTTAAIRRSSAHRRAHYRAMAVKSAAGSGETFWDEYDHRLRRGGRRRRRRRRRRRAIVLGRTRNAHLWRWPIPESVAALRALHDAGVPIGVVSNASGQIEEVLRAQRRLPGRATGPARAGAGRSSTATSSASPSPTRGSSTPRSAHFDGIDRSRDRLRRRLGDDGHRRRARGRSAPDPARPVRRPPRRRLRAHRVADGPGADERGRRRQPAVASSGAQSIDLDEYEERFEHAVRARRGRPDRVVGASGRPGRSVLDAGCGTGRVAIELHRRGLDVVGRRPGRRHARARPRPRRPTSRGRTPTWRRCSSTGGSASSRCRAT